MVVGYLLTSSYKYLSDSNSIYLSKSILAHINTFFLLMALVMELLKTLIFPITLLFAIIRNVKSLL